MNRLFLPIILCLLLAGCCTDRLTVQQAVEQQMRWFPQSTMQDIYKFFYQDRFGPGHMISDTAAAREYLQYELTQVAADTDSYAPPCEELGARGAYVRVHLWCVRENMLTEQQLLDAFIRSATPAKQPRRTWAEEWQHIARVAQESGMACTEEESHLLMQAAQCNRAVHHSDAYRQAYRPHYRIVRRDIFEEELRRYIYKTL